MKSDLKSQYAYSFENNSDYNLKITSLGRSVRKAEIAWNSSLADYYTLHFAASGKSEFIINGSKSYTVKENDAILICPKTNAYFKTSELPYIHYWINFKGIEADNLISKTDFSSRNPVMTINPEIKKCISKIISNQGAQDWQSAYILGQFYLIFSELIKLSENTHAGSDLSKIYISKAIEYIKDNFFTDISIKQVADYVGISTSHLYRVFMKEINKPPIEYLNDFKIKQSCILLKDKSLSISDIAYRSGFSDPLYFSKCFSKAMGCSPSEYRKMQ